MPPTDEHNLTIIREFSAPPEKVFKAWSDPDLLKVWMGGQAVSVPYAEVDFQVGGRYRVRLQPPDGKPFTVEGEYQEIDPPKRIVYTWTFVGGATETGMTLVSVDFVASQKGTTVTLLHEKLPSETVKNIHNHGWIGLLDNVSDLLKTF